MREKQLKTPLTTPGERFRFRLGDLICPDREQAISQITPELELTGKILFWSDCGDQKKRFAVVEVKGVCSPLVVPIERLEPACGELEQVQCPESHEAGRPQ